MRWTARAQDRIRGLTFFIAGFLLVCVVATAHAGVRINPTSARYASTTASGVRTATTFEATLTGTANGVRNYAVPVPVSSSTLGGLAGAAMKRIGPAAALYQTAKSIVDGAGWAIDELTDQVVVPGVPQQPLGPVIYCATPLGGGQLGCSSTPQGLGQAIATRSTGPSAPYTFHSYNGSNRLYFCGKNGPSGGCAASVIVSTRTDPTGNWNPVDYPNWNYGSDPQPVTNQQLGDLLKNHPQVVNAILIDPETGAPIHTPELIQAMNDLRRSIEAANGIDPGPDATPKDPMETQPMESAWPTFCSWASTVCDFIGWVKTEDPDTARPEVPWEEETPLDVTQSWSSGLGGGSCPGPATFSVTLAGTTSSPEFSFEPICQFGTVMRPVIIALAAIVAGFILAGVRGSKDA